MLVAFYFFLYSSIGKIINKKKKGVKRGKKKVYRAI
jgi:hypothetical protein